MPAEARLLLPRGRSESVVMSNASDRTSRGVFSLRHRSLSLTRSSGSASRAPKAPAQSPGGFAVFDFAVTRCAASNATPGATLNVAHWHPRSAGELMCE
eukprot:1490968-Rhodomonas_salina.2